MQNDLFGGNPVITGQADNTENGGEWLLKSDANTIPLVSALGEQDESSITSVSSVAFASTGLEPVSDIWHIPALQDDTEHLQDMAYRLTFEIAETMGCADCVRRIKIHVQQVSPFLKQPVNLTFSLPVFQVHCLTNSSTCLCSA